MNRGDRREAIFADDDDRHRFLKTLGEACEKTGWQVHAFCLMANHFHLVVETPQPNLVAGMKWLLGTRAWSTGGVKKSPRPIGERRTARLDGGGVGPSPQRGPQESVDCQPTACPHHDDPEVDRVAAQNGGMDARFELPGAEAQEQRKICVRPEWRLKSV
jgi:hypothetical protein